MQGAGHGVYRGVSYDPARHRRRSIRLPGHDYSRPGAYFVTLCAHGGRCLFGEVEGGEVKLSAAGRAMRAAWEELPNHYPHVRLDAFVVMPNHVHGIVCLLPDGAPPADPAAPDPAWAGTRPAPTWVGAARSQNGSSLAGVGAPLVGAQPRHAGATGTKPTRTLGEIVGAFKSRSTLAYIRGVRQAGWPRFHRRVWQRNYWERVIRDEHELDLARRYIIENPLRWHLDRMHPDRRPW